MTIDWPTATVSPTPDGRFVLAVDADISDQERPVAERTAGDLIVHGLRVSVVLNHLRVENFGTVDATRSQLDEFAMNVTDWAPREPAAPPVDEIAATLTEEFASVDD